MPSARISTARAVIVYTLLRVLLFAAVWAVLWYLTPLDALWSAAAALLISGAISVVVLDRQRGRVGAAAGSFFSRMNARIDAATRAEDVDDVIDAGAPDSAQGKQGSEQEPVGEQQDPGLLEGGHEVSSASPSEDDPQR